MRSSVRRGPLVVLRPLQHAWRAPLRTPLCTPLCTPLRVRIALLMALMLPGNTDAQTAAGNAAANAPAARRATGTAQGTVRTDTLWAQSLGIRKALTVYLPPSYGKSPSRRYPVLFYLHGLYGNERNWVEQGALSRTLDSLAAAGKPEAIVVMPDGDDGWYTTWNQLIDASVCRSDTTRREPAATYCVPWPHYDDYIANDIVSHVDRHYRTIPQRASRGIAGLSMGGYGAITLALTYPHVFGAAASHSGVLSPRYLGPKPYGAPARYAMTKEELRTVDALQLHAAGIRARHHRLDSARPRAHCGATETARRRDAGTDVRLRRRRRVHRPQPRPARDAHEAWCPASVQGVAGQARLGVLARALTREPGFPAGARGSSLRRPRSPVMPPGAWTLPS